MRQVQENDDKGNEEPEHTKVVQENVDNEREELRKSSQFDRQQPYILLKVSPSHFGVATNQEARVATGSSPCRARRREKR